MARGRHTFLLDGDNIRHGLNRDLGFTEADRIENMRRVGEVARLMADAGLIVLTAFISPFRAEREMVRKMLPEGEFIEVFVDTPLADAEKRDPKGLYAKARAGEIKNFTGIDSPYEPPENAEIVIDTMTLTAEAAADRIVEELSKPGGLADKHDDNTRGERVERAGVADAFRFQRAAHAGDHVVRRDAGGFVDDENAVQESKSYAFRRELRCHE